jgi:transcriptional regulator with XRE-family HTH domain
MKASIERADFSARLQLALRNAGYSLDSPTKLAREFNIRFQGRSVTAHAVRKWLVGEALPTQEKLRALAQWLGVAATWLRFGDTAEASLSTNGEDSSSRSESLDIRMIGDLQLLDESHRTVAREIIRTLVHLNRKK